MKTKLSLISETSKAGEQPGPPIIKIILNGVDLTDKTLKYNLNQDTNGAILKISIVIDEINGNPPALRKDRGE